MWGMLTQWRLGKNIGDDLTLVLGFVDRSLSTPKPVNYVIHVILGLLPVRSFLSATRCRGFSIATAKAAAINLTFPSVTLLKSEEVVFTHSPFSIRNSVLPSSDQFHPSLVLSQLI